MESRMKESYREGVANRPGPDHARVSRGALEALDRGICRLGIELRDKCSGVPTPSSRSEGNTRAGRKREAWTRPRGDEGPMQLEELHAREPGDLVTARGSYSGPEGERDER